jgi:TRAP-type C4-dicarboxylate transport system substrate-binding protein
MALKVLPLLMAGLLVAASHAALAQDKPVKLTLSTWLPPAHQINTALQEWADDIEKTSGGSLAPVLFTSEQLGKAFDHYDMTRDGLVDFGLVNPGYQPGRFPIVAAGELPFLIANGRGGSAAMDSWYAAYREREMKDVRVCFILALEPGVWNGKKKILMPADIRGLKVRPANATVGAFVTLLGGTNVQASAPEAREVLERGVADEITFTLGTLMLFGMDKVVNYHMDEPFYSVTFAWVMNKAKYASLPPSGKAVIDAHCTPDWAEKVATPFALFEQNGRAQVSALPGHDVYKLTPEQKKAWREAALPLKARWAARVKDVDPDTVYNGLTGALRAHDALSE